MSETFEEHKVDGSLPKISKQIHYANRMNCGPGPRSIIRALELMLLRLEAHEREIRNINAGWDGW